MNELRRNLIAWRIVFGGLITALYARAVEFVIIGIGTVIDPIVEHPLLPEIFLSGRLVLVAYGLPLLGFCAFFCGHKIVLRLVSILTLACSLFLLWGTCFGTDATFVSASWVSAWLIWFSFRMSDRESGFAKRATLFGKGIVGLIFLGGATGKLTEAYWDGGVFFRLYFESSTYWFFSMLRGIFEAGELDLISKWVSRLAIFTELVLGTIVVWPIRWAFVAVAGALSGMLVVFHPAIYSAVGALFWLLAGCYYLTRDSMDPKRGKSSDDNTKKGAV